MVAQRIVIQRNDSYVPTKALRERGVGEATGKSELGMGCTEITTARNTATDDALNKMRRSCGSARAKLSFELPLLVRALYTEFVKVALFAVAKSRAINQFSAPDENPASDAAICHAANAEMNRAPASAAPRQRHGERDAIRPYTADADDTHRPRNTSRHRECRDHADTKHALHARGHEHEDRTDTGTQATCKPRHQRLIAAGCGRRVLLVNFWLPLPELGPAQRPPSHLSGRSNLPRHLCLRNRIQAQPSGG